MLSNNEQTLASLKEKFLRHLGELCQSAGYEPQFLFFLDLKQFSYYIQPAFCDFRANPEIFLEKSKRLEQYLDDFIEQLEIRKIKERKNIIDQHLKETESSIRTLLEEILPKLYSHYRKFFEQFMQHHLILKHSDIIKSLAELRPNIRYNVIWKKIYALPELRKLLNCIYHVEALHQPLEPSAVQQIEKYLKTILPILDQAKLTNNEILLADFEDSDSEYCDGDSTSSEEEEDTLEGVHYVIRVAAR